MELSSPKIEEEWLKKLKKNQNNNYIYENSDSQKERKRSTMKLDSSLH